jgi:hypothetical protein
MSYCRFSDGDVYVFLDIHGYFSCCGCFLDKDRPYPTTEDIIIHLREHEAAGHYVPEFTFQSLEADREENDKWIAEQNVNSWSQ